jgi:hypothetical protein
LISHLFASPDDQLGIGADYQLAPKLSDDEVWVIAFDKLKLRSYPIELRRIMQWR